MGLQEAYNAEVEAIRTGQMSHVDEAQCGCRGGWFLTDFDTWEECPAHPGRRHPEDYQEMPFFQIHIENADGSPYKGVIGWEPDGDQIVNDGAAVYSVRDNGPQSLKEAQAKARQWRSFVNRRFSERNLKVRLHRVCLNV